MPNCVRSGARSLPDGERLKRLTNKVRRSQTTAMASKMSRYRGNRVPFLLTKWLIPVINRGLRLKPDVENGVRTYLQGLRRGKVQWHVLDAEGQVLGRLATRAAMLLMGKTHPDFTPHEDHRDGLIIINAKKVRLTGNKLDDKIYRRHTGYPGGLKEISARKRMETRSEDVVRDAITGMLPKSRIGSKLATRLKVYTGPAHPHGGQQSQVEGKQPSA